MSFRAFYVHAIILGRH